MPVISTPFMRKFLKRAGERLSGEWVLVGGALLPALGIDSRVTVDIDVVNISKARNDPTLKLLELAEDLGLPAGTISQAALYYLKKIKKIKKHLILLYSGAKATIFRPDATLFIELKMSRLTESDLIDCLNFIKFAKKNDEPIDTVRLIEHLDQEEKTEWQASKTERLKSLKVALLSILSRRNYR